MTETKTIGELVAAVLAKRDEADDVKRASDAIKAALEQLEAELSERMNEEGCQSFKAADGRLVYKSRDIYVNVPAGNRAALVEACRLLGMEEMVKTEVPTASLKSRVREWMGDLGDAEQIPEQLRSLIHVHEDYSIRVRKS